MSNNVSYKFRNVSRKTKPICYLPNGNLVAYKYGKILIYNHSGQIVLKNKVFSNGKECIFSRCRLLYRLMRLGIRSSIAIDKDTILISMANKIYEYDVCRNLLSNGIILEGRQRPLTFTEVCNIDGMPDGIYFGGYLNNPNKKPVHIYKRVRKDCWEIVYTFPERQINHIHNIIADQYRNCLWCFTGDFNQSAAIWKITNNFQHVECVKSNNQNYRSCVAFALEEGLLYATDTPFAVNSIYLMNTDNYMIQSIFPIAGSCIYGCMWQDKFVFSSTCEGDGRDQTLIEVLFNRKRGSGIMDDYAHMYCGNLKQGFKEVYKRKKDIWPFIFQFGAFTYPSGNSASRYLFFQPTALKGCDLSMMCMEELLK